MSDPNEVPGGRPPVLMTGKEPPRPWRPPVAPSPQRFDAATARSAVTAALRTGSLASGLAPGRAALEASNRALAEVEQGVLPDAALKGWAERLPAPPARAGRRKAWPTSWTRPCCRCSTARAAR